MRTLGIDPNEARRPEPFEALARSRTPQARGRLLLAVSELCDSAAAAGALDPAAVDELLAGVLLQLAGEVERDIRRLLSEKLARADWPPQAIVNMLALDEIEIARPVILSSPVLKDADLVRILVSATLEHQVAVASRAPLGEPVVEAIVRRCNRPVLAALAANTGARIGAGAMDRLVDAAQGDPSLCEPLAVRADICAHHAARLYRWVGRSLQVALCERFRMDAQALQAPLKEAVAQAFAGQRQDPCPDLPERDEAERRLVAKLHGAGQLKPRYLLRALREARLAMFECALARLGGFSVEQVQRATCAAAPHLLALACAGVGLDRSVFPTVLTLVRGLNGGRPLGEAAAAVRAAEAFAAYPQEAAAAAFRTALPI